MSTLGGSNFTNFQNIRIKGTADGVTAPGVIRLVSNSSFENTISINTTYVDANYTYTLPAKSGKFAIGGTFAVDLPAVAAAGYQSTIVTITGLRVEDGIVVTPQSIAAGGVQSARGALTIVNAVPTADALTLTFANLFATASIAVTQGVCSYAVFR